MLTMYVCGDITRDYVACWDGKARFDIRPCLADPNNGSLTIYEPVNASGLEPPPAPTSEEAQAHGRALLDQMARCQIDVRNEAPARSTAKHAPGRQPAPIGPSADVARDRLVPGVRVMRYTEPLRSRRNQIRFFLRVPCCQRKVRLAYDYEGPLDVPLLCVPCRMSYACQAWPDSDGGMWACLTVEEFSFILASAR